MSLCSFFRYKSFTKLKKQVFWVLLRFLTASLWKKTLRDRGDFLGGVQLVGRKITKITGRFIGNDTSEYCVFQKRNFATGGEISDWHAAQITQKIIFVFYKYYFTVGINVWVEERWEGILCKPPRPRPPPLSTFAHSLVCGTKWRLVAGGRDRSPLWSKICTRRKSMLCRTFIREEQTRNPNVEILLESKLSTSRVLHLRSSSIIFYPDVFAETRIPWRTNAHKTPCSGISREII